MKLKDIFVKTLSLFKKYIHVGEDTASYYFGREENTLSIFFEWSNGERDWLNNFLFLPIPKKPYSDMDHLWFCHMGFFKVWKTIEPHLADAIKDITVERIDISGYSHGAAIAQLCYEYVKYHRPDVDVTGVGFGAPRVFWGFINKTIKRRVEDFIVVRNGNDIVTHLPPVIFGFRHIGKVLKVGESVGPIKDHYPDCYREALGKYDDSL